MWSFNSSFPTSVHYMVLWYWDNLSLCLTTWYVRELYLRALGSMPGKNFSRHSEWLDNISETIEKICPYPSFQTDVIRDIFPTLHLLEITLRLFCYFASDIIITFLYFFFLRWIVMAAAHLCVETPSCLIFITCPIHNYFNNNFIRKNCLCGVKPFWTLRHTGEMLLNGLG
jgi:hypothetical protein